MQVMPIKMSTFAYQSNYIISKVKFTRIIFSTVALISLFLPTAMEAAVPGLAQRLRQGLSDCTSASDSLKVLLDVYDASENDDQAKIGREVLNLAERIDNQGVIQDFILQLAVLQKKDDAALRALVIEAEKLDDRDDRKGAQLFVNVMRAINEVTYIPDSEYQKALLKYARADMIPTGDLYQDILDLYRVVIFLGKSAKNNLYLEYVTRLENMIKKLPENRYYIRNLFYTTAAITHTQNGNCKKAIEADKELLDVIGKLEKKNKEAGRQYKDYSRNYYICYRRILRNYKCLTLDEVKDYYTKCAMLAEKDKNIREDFYETGRPVVYRLMAEHRYGEAIPKIKAAIARNEDRNIHTELMQQLVEAADSVGDQKTLLEALRECNAMQQRQLEQNSEEAYRELHIRYDINNLKKENTKLEVEKRDSELRSGQKLITIVLAAMLVLAVLLMVLYRRHFNLRQQCHDLKKENERLNKYMEEMLNDGKPSGTLDLRNGTEYGKTGKTNS